MILNQINPISFTGKIIDAHTHIGKWNSQYYPVSALDTFSKQPLSNGDTIDRMIVSNLSCIESDGMLDEINGNIELLKASKQNSKLAPLVVCQPKTGNVDNIRKLFNENPDGFFGLKFHPETHEIFASDKRLEPYLKFAQEKKLPCLFHCGIAWENGKLVPESRRFSSPSEIYAAARKIPDTPVILGHLGSGGKEVHAPAMDVLMSSIKKADATLYTDISWVDINSADKPTIVELIKKLKNTEKGDMTNRILFGSDVPIGEYSAKNGLSGKSLYEKVVVDIKNAIKKNFDDANELIEKIFYKNAEELFFKGKQKINEQTKTAPPKVKRLSKTKMGIAAGIGAVLIGFAGYFFYNKPVENNANFAEKTRPSSVFNTFKAKA